MLVMKNAGIIGTVAAVRPVLSRSNYDLILILFNRLLIENEMLKVYLEEMALAYMLTKQNRTSTNDERFHLLADPSIRLNIPQIQAHIEKVNDKHLNTRSYY